MSGKFLGLRHCYEAAVGAALEPRTLRSKEIARRAIRHYSARQVSERMADSVKLCCLAALGSHLKRCSYSGVVASG